MAPGFYSAVPPPPNLDPNAPTTTLPLRPAPTTPPRSTALPLRPAQASRNSTPIDIEAWTVAALESLNVSPSARGTGRPLAIALDDEPRRLSSGVRRDVPPGALPSRKVTPVRDNLKRREELRKGKEGSRQRRRWENDRLIGVPNTEPPLPVDLLPRPTHPVTHVPYHVAQYWETGIRQRTEEKTAGLAAARKRHQRQTGSATGLGAGEVSREVRDSAKRTPVVRTWVRELEEPVRRFVRGVRGGGEEMEEDEDEDEVLFTGRKEAEGGWKRARRETGDGDAEAGMVFEPLADDEAAAVKRWLAHAISDYYGLDAKSVTVGNPGRRVVYLSPKASRHSSMRQPHFPRPMWEVC